MSELWSTLIPLGIGSAVVPIQIVVTILLLQAPDGARTAAAWVAGMTAPPRVAGPCVDLVGASESSDLTLDLWGAKRNSAFQDAPDTSLVGAKRKRVFCLISVHR